MNIQYEQDPSEGAPIPSCCKYVEKPQAGKISIVDTVFELRILIDRLIVPGIIACVPASTKQSIQAMGCRGILRLRVQVSLLQSPSSY